MSEGNEEVTSGLRAISDWAENRFPEATIYEPERRPAYYRWTIDFGPDKAGFRLGVTPKVLASPSILQQRLHDLEEGKWLSNADVVDKWVVMNAVGIVAVHPDEW